MGGAALVNRSAEALEALLNGDPRKAAAQVELLLMSELVRLHAAAGQLVELAGSHVIRRCEVCGGTVVWDTNEPTRQRPGWRHADQAASYRAGAHRAKPH